MLSSRDQATPAPASVGTTPNQQHSSKLLQQQLQGFWFVSNFPPSVLSRRLSRDSQGCLRTWPDHTPHRLLLRHRSVSWAMACWICWPVLCYTHIVFAPKQRLHPNQINTCIFLQRKQNKVASIVNEKSAMFWHLSCPYLTSVALLYHCTGNNMLEKLKRKTQKTK